MLYIQELFHVYSTNRPDFFMVCTLIDHRNDAIKCSKLKWDHKPRASFTAEFRTFYGVISTVYKSTDHEKIWSIRKITRKICKRNSPFSIAKLSN